jgi:hypothetical protein
MDTDIPDFSDGMGDLLAMNMAAAEEAAEEDVDDDDNPDDDEDPPTALVTAPPTFVEMYKMSNNECGVTLGTEKGFHAIMAAWCDYCTLRQRPPYSSASDAAPDAAPHTIRPGLGLYDDPDALNQKNEQLYNHEVVDGFFRYLVPKRDSENKFYATGNTMKIAKTFLNAHLRCEFYALLKSAGIYSRSGEISVGKSVAVKRCVKAVRERKASEAIEQFTDLLGDVDNVISDEEIRNMLVSVYCPKAGGKFEKCNDLYKLEFAASFNASSSNVRRGEEQRSGRLCNRFIRRVRGFGPNPGLPVSMFLTNHGKHNQDGRVEYTGAGPHCDPLRDTAATLGVLHLYRFVVSGEPFPNFLVFKDFMSVWTYPSHTDRSKAVCAKSYSNTWRAPFEEQGVRVSKLTHQWRRQSQQEMDNMGVSTPHIERMAGTASGDKKQSRSMVKCYLTPPPVPAVAERCNADPKNPLSHNPAWIAVMGEPLRAVLRVGIPTLLEQQQQVHAEWGACTTFQQRQDGRWPGAKESIDSMIHDISRAFQMFASRPICPLTGELLFDSPTHRDLFKEGAFCSLLHLPVFSSKEYADFEALVKVAQDTYFRSAITLTAPVRNELDRILTEKVGGRLTAIERELCCIRVSCISSGSGGSGGSGQPSIDSRNYHQSTGGLQPSLPPQTDTLVNGAPRKRHRPITQQAIISAVASRQGSEGESHLPLVVLDDHWCTTLEDYWRLYKEKWSPLERTQGASWRTDRQLPGLHKIGSRSTWWSTRKHMYALVNYYLATGLSEEDALLQANVTFCSVKLSKGNRRPIKAVSIACKAKLEELGQRILKGRPKKKPRNDGTAFAAAFPNLE